MASHPTASYPNGSTHLTTAQPSSLLLRSNSNPSEVSLPTPVKTCSDNFTPEDQIRILSKHLVSTRPKINVCFPTGGEKKLAEDVATRLKFYLLGENIQIAVVEMKKGEQQWLVSTEGSVRFYVFVGLPLAGSQFPFVRQNSSTQMEEFFNPYANDGRQVSQVVFVDLQPTTPSSSLRLYIPKNLNRFLHLDGKLHPDELATRVLGHFAATQPLPYAKDKAYWSSSPKLVVVTLDKPSLLGVKLVTREMSPLSLFPRIVLIKAFNEDSVCRRLILNTHIQSINGCFLDGLGIGKIINTVQSEMKKTKVQLMVRFIHHQDQPSTPYPSVSLMSAEDAIGKWCGVLGPNCIVKVDEVHKTEGDGLGILIGSSDESCEREHPFYGFMRHLINYIDPQGHVGRHNVLEIGDEILEINSNQLVGLPHQEAIEVIKKTPGFVQIVVCRTVRKEVHRDREVAVVNPTTPSAQQSTERNEPQIDYSQTACSKEHHSIHRGPSVVTSVLLSRGCQTEVNYSLTGPISDRNSVRTAQHRTHRPQTQTGNFRECTWKYTTPFEDTHGQSVRESQSEINHSQTTCRCSNGQILDCTIPSSGMNGPVRLFEGCRCSRTTNFSPTAFSKEYNTLVKCGIMLSQVMSKDPQFLAIALLQGKIISQATLEEIQELSETKSAKGNRLFNAVLKEVNSLPQTYDNLLRILELNTTLYGDVLAELKREYDSV